MLLGKDLSIFSFLPTGCFRHSNPLITKQYDASDRVKVVYFRSKKAGIRLLEYPLSLILLTYV